ncbi:MAG: peptidylprolyl isomerase [Spirochaetes bacterium]|nr:peptidylprolyl isomerase [Spirochaetota bacterium]HOD15794.1 peptidylprolyl isomerase [Spirochaetota bacterium]
MKKMMIFTIVAAVAFSAASCKRAGDVLATYNGGTITRGEFYDWMDARRMAKDAILKKKQQQKTHLERFAVERFVVREAVKAGFDKKEDFQFLRKLATRNFYSQYLGRQMSSEGSFSEKAVKASIIKFAVKNFKIVQNRREKLTPAELETALKEKEDKARTVIKELDGGLAFDEAAKKYSDDFSKRKGGDIGFVLEGMRGQDFSKAVFAVKSGTYTKEPVRVGNAVYIIKAEESVEINEDNIDDVIEDKAQQAGMKRRLTYNAALRLQEKLIKAKDVENNTETVVLTNPAAIVYRLGKTEFTVADLNKLIDFVMSKRKMMGRSDMKVEDKMRRELAKKILREDVMMREAVKRGIDKEEKFVKELKIFLDYNLSSTYESDVILGGITVTPQDVQDYYNKNKDRMYTRTSNEGGKNVKKVIPFAEVRPSIERRLHDIKRSDKRKSWVEELLSSNKFKIDDDELEGK